jgi:serine/threonine-protein kinase
MELLDGMNAEHFVYRFGPIAPGRVASWLVQACHSLGEAHARGLVHRDIKPANLFLCRYGRDCDFVKVLDFGLTLPDQTAADPRLTAPGARMGTPAYMAPEQVFGVADARTDLYALGCVGYFLLCGERPFEGDTGELLRQHVHTAPPPLGARARQPIPARLEAVVMSCLAKQPAERPDSADALSAALAEGAGDAHWTEAEARAWWDANLQTP